MRVLLNHAGNVNPEVYEKYGMKKITEPLKKTCTRVFREMVIKYDGVVPICCIDWKRECPIGKFPEKSLHEIWNGKEFNAIVLKRNEYKRYYLRGSNIIKLLEKKYEQ